MQVLQTENSDSLMLWVIQLKNGLTDQIFLLIEID